MRSLLEEIKSCTICSQHLPLGPNPVVAASPESRIMIIGQAPGKAVHQSGIPWNDPSGQQLRRWMGVDEATFYNSGNIALMPMGFCYPGKGRSGDLPPRPECAPQWHKLILQQMPNIQLTLLIGQYAQKHYLGHQLKANLTSTVKAWKDFLPHYLPLPHPSPRNRLWQSKNPWFAKEVVPELQQRIRKIL